MNDSRSTHLSSDELDLWLEGRLPEPRASHIETCSECREAAEDTREVAARLGALPFAAPPGGFTDRVLIALSAAGAPIRVGEHLNADDLDLWIAGELPLPRQRHLLSCPDCRRLADQERTLVLRLQALPLFDPAPGFGDRVMDQVTRPVPAWVRVARGWRARAFASRRSTAIAAGLAVAVVGSMGGSIAWSLANQDTLAALGSQLSNSAGDMFWMSLRALASNIIEQPWYDEVRASATPGWITAVSAAAVTLYTAGVLAMRRLLTAPARAVRALP